MRSSPDNIYKAAQGQHRYRSNSCHPQTEIIVGRGRRGVQVSVTWPVYAM